MITRDQGPPEIVIFCFWKHIQWLHSLLICSFLILSFLTQEIYCTYKIMCLPLCKKMWEFLFPWLLFFSIPYVHEWSGLFLMSYDHQREGQVCFVWSKLSPKTLVCVGLFYRFYLVLTNELMGPMKLYLDDPRRTCLQTLALQHVNLVLLDSPFVDSGEIIFL